MRPSDSLRIRRATPADAAAISAIYNHAVLNSTATFDTQPESVDERRHWLQTHDDRFVVLVAEIDSRVVGWSSLTRWSQRPAYEHTAETSTYVSHEFRGRGVGRSLKSQLINHARQSGFRSILARVATGGAASLRLCREFGFQEIGMLREVGFKFGRWLDVHVMQLMLDPISEPIATQHPTEGAASDGTMGLRNVAILLFDDAEVLDFCGPFEVFSVAANLAVQREECSPFAFWTVAERPCVTARNGLSVNAAFLLDEHPPAHILLVPGGLGTRREINNPRIVEWIKRTALDSELTLSVCTGALLLGRAGVLDGLSATTHQAGLELLRELAPQTTVLENRRFVDNGVVITSAGIAAGIDMSLHVVERLLGHEAAVATARHMEYPRIESTTES